MATAWGAIQATRVAEAHVSRQVAKLRILYWFGVVFVLLHAVPALCIGGYSLGKANQFSEVYCASEERPAGSEVFEPDVMIANMDMLGSFWIAGGVFFLFLVYVVIVWFNRLQKVVQMPRLKGKVIGGFRECTQGLSSTRNVVWPLVIQR